MYVADYPSVVYYAEAAIKSNNVRPNNDIMLHCYSFHHSYTELGLSTAGMYGLNRPLLLACRLVARLGDVYKVLGMLTGCRRSAFSRQPGRW